MSRYLAFPLAAALLLASSGAGGAQSQPAAQAGTTAQSWPKTYNLNGLKVVMYQPQVASWPNYTVLNGLAAVQVTMGSEKPVFGTLNFTSYTSANFDEGTVVLAQTRITSTSWPGLSSADAAKLDAAIKAVPLNDKTIPLASVLASLEASKALPKSPDLKLQPPTIYSSEKPAILVVFDGKPILAPIGDTKLKFAVNTNWAVIEDVDGTYYLLNGEHWIKTKSPQGSWSPATAPKSFAQIPNDANWTDVHKYLGAAAPSSVPHVFVSTTPADLIAIDGTPKTVAVPGTHLIFVENTASDLFYYSPQSEWYVLLSGRWFKSAALSGPWTFASQSLPADFAKIPLNGPKGRVLVSVPGTPEAQYAAAATQVPQVATVHPSEAKLEIAYAGEPQFKPIQGASGGLQYAINTPSDVIKVAENQYYACQAAVWFTASSPKGPWTVARYVPQVIYSIPPSSPLFQDTFVHVYNPNGSVVVAEPTATPAQTDEAAVLVGFTAGYLSSYWWNGAWMYGTGWYYPPYYYAGYPPIYYGYPITWTGGSYYNPATGAYGRYGAVYGPYGGAAARSYYNPTTGTYARGGAVYGPNGSMAAGSFYNPRYGVGGRTVQGSSPYGSWGRTAVTTPRGNAYAGHASGQAGSVGAIATKNGVTAVGKSNATGDVYAGRDGNVYRNQDGSWQKYDNGSWNSMEKPSAPAQNRDVQQRPGGAQGGDFNRANAVNSLNRDFGARQSAGGFRGYGGGGFGGGGRSFGGGGRRR